MALDTGATYTMIPWEIAEALGYKPEMSKEKVTLITASGVETAPLIEIKKIKFLGEGLDNVAVVCHDLPPKSYVTGLLGSSFLITRRAEFHGLCPWVNGKSPTGRQA